MDVPCCSLRPLFELLMLFFECDVLDLGTARSHGGRRSRNAASVSGIARNEDGAATLKTGSGSANARSRCSSGVADRRRSAMCGGESEVESQLGSAARFARRTTTMAQFVSAAAANGAFVLAKLRERYHGLTPQGRTAVQAYAALNVLLLALVAFAVFYITPAGLLACTCPAPPDCAEITDLASFAESLKEMRYGKLLLLALLILTSFPPLFGYGTCDSLLVTIALTDATGVTLCGFAFGVQEGWLLASTGCLIGASLSFVLARTIARSLFAALLARDPIFKGLAAAVRAKGLPLVLLIRLCPFPFPYSNAFFASVETVQFSQFLIATLYVLSPP